MTNTDPVLNCTVLPGMAPFFFFCTYITDLEHVLACLGIKSTTGPQWQQLHSVPVPKGADSILLQTLSGRLISCPTVPT